MIIYRKNPSFYLNRRGGFRYQNPSIILPGGVATPQTPPVPAPIIPSIMCLSEYRLDLMHSNSFIL